MTETNIYSSTCLKVGKFEINFVDPKIVNFGTGAVKARNFIGTKTLSFGTNSPSKFGTVSRFVIGQREGVFKHVNSQKFIFVLPMSKMKKFHFFIFDSTKL